MTVKLRFCIEALSHFQLRFVHCLHSIPISPSRVRFNFLALLLHTSSALSSGCEVSDFLHLETEIAVGVLVQRGSAVNARRIAGWKENFPSSGYEIFHFSAFHSLLSFFKRRLIKIISSIFYHTCFDVKANNPGVGRRKSRREFFMPFGEFGFRLVSMKRCRKKWKILNISKVVLVEKFNVFLKMKFQGRIRWKAMLVTAEGDFKRIE